MNRLNPEPIEVVAMASRRNLNVPVFEGIPFVDDIFSLAEREDIDVLVELIGGTDDALHTGEGSASQWQVGRYCK